MDPKLALHCCVAKDYLELLRFLLSSLEYDCRTETCATMLVYVVLGINTGLPTL